MRRVRPWARLPAAWRARGGVGWVSVAWSVVGPIFGTIAGPGPAHSAFDRPPLDPGGAALGGVLATAADPAFGNPAALAAGAPEVRFGWARPFGLRELSEAQVSAAWPGRVGLAAGARRFGTEAYAEKEARFVVGLGLGAGGKPGGKPGGAAAVAPGGKGAWAAGGAALRYLEASGAGFAPHRTVAVDIAFRVEPGPGWSLGAVAETVLGEVPGDPRGQGRRTSVGAVRRVGPLTFHAEAQRAEDRPLAAVGGVAWDLAGFRLALGAREDPGSVAGGLSIPLPGLAVTLAGTWVSPLGTTLRVGVCFEGGSPGRATNDSSAWTESRSLGWSRTPKLSLARRGEE